jgi:hypothetical protein
MYTCHGKYTVKNRSKYIGHQDPLFRSSWEERVCNFLDTNQKVKRWGYEILQIPYQGIDGKIHKYIVDFYVEIECTDRKIRKYAIEIKPLDQGPIVTESGEFIFSNKPQPPKKKTTKAMRNYIYKQQMYLKNMQKWSALQRFCKAHNMIFKVMDDKIVF